MGCPTVIFHVLLHAITQRNITLRDQTLANEMRQVAGRPVLFCNIREEISDGLYDYPHRILRFVHVWAEMASIPREKMRCLASLRRGEYRPIFRGE